VQVVIVELAQVLDILKWKCKEFGVGYIVWGMWDVFPDTIR
jgi:hypothetical protein